MLAKGNSLGRPLCQHVLPRIWSGWLARLFAWIQLDEAKALIDSANERPPLSGLFSFLCPLSHRISP